MSWQSANRRKPGKTSRPNRSFIDKEDNLQNTREFGKFILDIPLKSEDYILINKTPNMKNLKGLFIISFELDNKTNLTDNTLNIEDEI